MPTSLKRWWRKIVFEPNDPRFWNAQAPKVAAIGGGTGLSILLKGLKNYFDDISAIVTMTDDGASSGVIRQEFDTLPPGDIRKCISALAQDEELVSKVLEYRFNKKEKIFAGHTLGNIWIAALTKYFGSFEKALEATLKIFATRGNIYPSTLDSVKLAAVYENDGKEIGESKIAKPGSKIKKIYFSKNPKPYPKALQAIRNADLIVAGPGSLFTSILPNLIIKEIAAAIKKNQQAVKIYIANCSTERGETESFSVEEHLETINRITGAKLFDYLLVNSRIIKRSKNESTLGTVNNITTKRKNHLGVEIFRADIIDHKNPLIHDSEKLAQALSRIYKKTRR